MNHAHRLLRPLTCAIMLAAPAAVALADSTVWITMGPISYQLEDADLTDGITPALTWTSHTSHLELGWYSYPDTPRVQNEVPFSLVALPTQSATDMAGYPNLSMALPEVDGSGVAATARSDASGSELALTLTSGTGAFLTGKAETESRYILTPMTRVRFTLNASALLDLDAAVVDPSLRHQAHATLRRMEGGPELVSRSATTFISQPDRRMSTGWNDWRFEWVGENLFPFTRTDFTRPEIQVNIYSVAWVPESSAVAQAIAGLGCLGLISLVARRRRRSIIAVHDRTVQEPHQR